MTFVRFVIEYFQLVFLIDLFIMHKAKYEFLFIGRDDNSFLENYYYDLFQDHGEKSGQIFINWEIQNNPLDAEEIGAAVFETMQKSFFENMEVDPYERFEMSLKAVNATLNDFKSEKSSGYIGNLNAVIAAVVGGTLYLTQTGDAEAYLIRKRYVSIVSEGLNDENSADVFTNIASGKIEDDDFVLFSSTRLLRYISKTDLARCAGNKTISESLAEVRDVISTEMLGRVGLTGILFGGRQEVDSSVIEEEKEVTKPMFEDDDDFDVEEKPARGFKSRAERGKGFSSIVWDFFGKAKDVFVRLFRGLFSSGFGKDKILAVLVIVIVVLGAGIWIANGSIAEREELEKLDNVLTGVQEKMAEAETKGSYDKDTAKAILDKAYEDAMSVLNSGYYRDKATLYLNQIEETRDNLDNVNRVADLQPFVDLSKKRSDVNALGFVEVGDRVFAFEYNALYEIVLDQVQDPLTIDDNEVVIDAVGFDERNSVVFLTKSGKLMEYRNGTMSFMDTDDGTFHKASAIKDWSSRVYLLDTASSQIWKYTYKGLSEKFGSAEPYLTDNTVDISNAVDFAIDSNVYVLKSTGDVLKFLAGVKAEFYINHPPFNALNNSTVIYTKDKLNDVYVLDSKEGRILVFGKDTKTGNLDYKSQYLIDGVGEIRDLYVDVTTKKMYVLTASKVYEVAM